MVPLARIPTDDKAQTRVKVNGAAVRDYAAAMTEHRADGGVRFPPDTVQRRPGLLAVALFRSSGFS